MKVIGYGICGPGEADRYLRQTLEEFKRLECDEVIILCNNTSRAEEEMIDEFGFKRSRERREWGKFQWKIKQDFLERDVRQYVEEGDMLVCLDMDERFDKHLTREWLENAPLDAYHVFVVDLWNDEQHYKPESCFWNVRIWRWNGQTEFKPKPVHCGLAPQWAYHYHRFAPFLLIHTGLMDPADRERKIARYEKYDPNAIHLEKKYYDMLKDDKAVPFDEEAVHATIAAEVETYAQTKPRVPAAAKPKLRYAYVKMPDGRTVDIPDGIGLLTTLQRPGVELIGWADDTAEEMEQLFGDVNIDEPAVLDAGGSYQRPQADEAAELAKLNAADAIPPAAAVAGPQSPAPVAPAAPAPKKAAAAKKAAPVAKKAARKSTTSKR